VPRCRLLSQWHFMQSDSNHVTTEVPTFRILMFDKLTVAKLVTTFPSLPTVHPQPYSIQFQWTFSLIQGLFFFTTNIVSHFPSQFRHARVRLAGRTTFRRYRVDRKWQPIVVRWKYWPCTKLSLPSSDIAVPVFGTVLQLSSEAVECRY